MQESDMRKWLIAGVAGLAFAGCSPQTQPETPAPEQQAAAPPAAETQQGNTPAEDLDPFVVMIGAERWTVILERAIEGAIAATDANAIERSDLYRADAALKRGAAMVIELRNWVCGKGLVAGADCNLPEWPAWTRELPTGDTPMVEIDRRSAWLSEVMDPFSSAACEAGRKASGDELFCSVE
jgi:hypothetical protein